MDSVAVSTTAFLSCGSCVGAHAPSRAALRAPGKGLAQAPDAASPGDIRRKSARAQTSARGGTCAPKIPPAQQTATEFFNPLESEMRHPQTAERPIELEPPAAFRLAIAHGKQLTRQLVHRTTAPRPQSQGTDRGSGNPAQPGGWCPCLCGSDFPSCQGRQTTVERRNPCEDGGGSQGTVGEKEGGRREVAVPATPRVR